MNELEDNYQLSFWSALRVTSRNDMVVEKLTQLLLTASTKTLGKGKRPQVMIVTNKILYYGNLFSFLFLVQFIKMALSLFILKDHMEYCVDHQ